MARPSASAPTVSSFLRGKSVYVRYSYSTAGVKLVKSTGVSVPVADDASQLDKAGYIKRALSATAVIDNATIELVRDTLQAAHKAAGNTVTAATIEAHYSRLLEETQALADAKRKAAAAKAEAQRQAKLQARVRGVVDMLDADTIDDEISDLELLLLEKKQRRSNLLRNESKADDTLATWLLNHAKRNGKDTLAASTLRGFNCFVNTVKRFDETARIQGIDNIWLTNFQDWLTTNKAIRPNKYNSKIAVGETRKNTTIENYLTKIKTCLNYYSLYDDLLPEGIKVNNKYKRFEFVLPLKTDNVITLEESEIAALMEMEFTKNKEQARLLLLFCCATSLRYVDAITINRSNIDNGYIKKATQKGAGHGTVVHIPLNPVSLYVLERCNYDLSSIALGDHIAVPFMKELCSLIPSMHKEVQLVSYSGREDVGCKVKRYEAIGTHSGRRSYINIHADYNVPLHVLMSHTGHTNLKVLQTYMQSRRTMKTHTLNIFNIPLQYNAQIA